MAFDPTNSRLFDPVTGAKLPVIKHVVFTPGVDSCTNLRPIHLQYIRDPVRGLGVQVIEECSASVEHSIHVFFGAAAGVFPTRAGRLLPVGDLEPWQALRAFERRVACQPGVHGIPSTLCLTAQRWTLTGAVAFLRPEPVVAEAPKDVHGNPFPLKLVQLHHFPADTWVGRVVFAPCGQTGDTPTWVDTDEPPQDASEDGPPGPHPAYDVGVVTRYEPDPDFADLGHMRVHFVGSHGSTLHYTAWNLWTPAMTAHTLPPLESPWA